MEVLLSEVLPKNIANDLKLGKTVQAESYENVTIFFSDIVGFTRISAAGTPIDVVKMLNLMYTTFDDVASRFDVYKVATIGDAYFVASGVPDRNGDRHAGEICSIGLKLLEVVSTLTIPHVPSEVLQLRMGIHSGPCLAGVVGIKMPRYLLFGDTVDIASKMESSGQAMAIHVSEVTVNLLQSSQSFRFEEREDVITIKGLGSFKTFWLKEFK